MTAVVARGETRGAREHERERGGAGATFHRLLTGQDGRPSRGRPAAVGGRLECVGEKGPAQGWGYPAPIGWETGELGVDSPAATNRIALGCRDGASDSPRPAGERARALAVRQPSSIAHG